MPTSQRFSPRLTDEQLAELVALLRQVDSVELKLTVPDEDRQSAAAALGVDPLNARIRQVYFFDTPDLALDAAGVVVRARRTQGAPDDNVIKLRPVVPDDLPRELRERKDFVVEVDAMPGKYVCSASFKGQAKAGAVMETVSGGQPLRKLFSKTQRAFFADHAPEGVGLDDLSVLGPVIALKLKVIPAGLGRKLAVELWLYPDGSRLLEISTKGVPEEAFQLATVFKAFLLDGGFTLKPGTSKTSSALSFFSRKRAA